MGKRRQYDAQRWPDMERGWRSGQFSHGAAANQTLCVGLPMQGARRLEFHSHRRPIGYRPMLVSTPPLLHAASELSSLLVLQLPLRTQAAVLVRMACANTHTAGLEGKAREGLQLAPADVCAHWLFLKRKRARCWIALDRW